MTITTPTTHAQRPRPWAGLVRDPGHGPLPAMLLVLTAATGLIDAVSILGLGRVFVANMTGNVVFVGFALAVALLVIVTATATWTARRDV